MDKAITINSLRVTLTKKSVNSKKLVGAMEKFVRDGLCEFSDMNGWDLNSHRETFVEIVDYGLSELAELGKIEQWNVMMDERNNDIVDVLNGHFNLIVTFKQRNCVNTTQLIYDIVDTNNPGHRRSEESNV